MSVTSPAAEFAELVNTVGELEDRFIKAHLAQPKQLTPSPAEVLDVAAYVVLAHGAFEDFVEGLALLTLDQTVTRWTYERKISRCTAALLLHQDAPNSREISLSSFDLIRKALEAAKEQVSGIVKDNHGIETRHLRQMFAPLGIDVPRDPILTSSLDSIVQIRHQWAHRYRFGTKVIKSASDVKIAMGDCLRLANKLTDDVVALLV